MKRADPKDSGRGFGGRSQGIKIYSHPRGSVKGGWVEVDT